MSRRKRASKQSQAVCSEIYDEIAKARQDRDLSNIVFAFPRVMTAGKWQDSGASVVAAIIKRRKMPQSYGEPRAFTITLDGVAAVEVPVDHEWMKKFRDKGCLTVYKFKPDARVKVPGDIADALDSHTVAIVDIPAFHLGMTWNWPAIEALQATAKRVGEERAKQRIAG
ncbi:MAG: hypothetical protein F4W95_10065 [Chloroflexi bacterium]|nr:hypothetical protein [Chloroflexota bacterium]MYD48816.1 hypothetical protein [Chloroflexota bacterium]